MCDPGRCVLCTVWVGVIGVGRWVWHEVCRTVCEGGDCRCSKD